jgi:hypothetical protein
VSQLPSYPFYLGVGVGPPGDAQLSTVAQAGGGFNAIRTWDITTLGSTALQYAQANNIAIFGALGTRVYNVSVPERRTSPSPGPSSLRDPLGSMRRVYLSV